MRARLAIGLLALSGLINPARAQHEDRPWWVSVELGDGQLQLNSNQITGSRDPTFAMGFAGGYSINRHVRVGGEINGWLIQAFNLQDPSVGESVSNLFGMIDVFPFNRGSMFVRAGAGLAMYENDRPLQFNGTGWAWIAGGGYEFPIAKRVVVAPMVDYAAGRFGDVDNPIAFETGRRYSVLEGKLALSWFFGQPRR